MRQDPICQGKIETAFDEDGLTNGQIGHMQMGHTWRGTDIQPA